MTSLRCLSFLPLTLVLLTGCSGDAAASKLDQTSPKGLAESIFAAARGGDLASLAGIASADADGDAKRVAGVAEAPADKQTEFRDYFGPGKVEGEVTIEGDKASVPIKFGPGAARDEKLEMVKANGVWYLQAF